MGIKDGTTPQSPIILSFPVENQPPQLSINTNADIGILYKKYGPLVLRRCREILDNEEDARDAAQNVFERKIQELKSKGQLEIQYPKTYLYKAANFMSINYINKNKRIRSLEKRARKEFIEIYNMATNESLKLFRNKGEQGQEVLEIGVIDKGRDQVEDDQVKAEIIVKAILDEQNETTRKIYFYKYRDDMTLEQIGEAVGLKKSAVQKRIKNLEKQARAEIGKAGK
jgi:RNA polymerase sigma-70 factor (ECF subfamily)